MLSVHKYQSCLTLSAALRIKDGEQMKHQTKFTSVAKFYKIVLPTLRGCALLGALSISIWSLII